MKRVLLMVGLCVLSGALTVAVLASVRYGGPGGLLMRVRAEIIRQRPPNAWVPTPLPTASGQSPSQPSPAAARMALIPSPTVTPLWAPARLGVTPVPSKPPTAQPYALVEPGPRVQLTGLAHAWQTWNNCGPATLSMYLSFWGVSLDQEAIRMLVRPNPEDKHAGADELADVARARGLETTVRIDGTRERLRLLLANGIPVMVSTWHEDEPGDGMGHYRLLVGYDDAAREWLVYDSLAATAADRNAPYQPLHMPYDEFEAWWKVFNRRYVLTYPGEAGEAVRAILAEDAEDAAMWAGALERAEADTVQTPEDAFAWFNTGSDLVALGRYDEAARAYDRARALGLPWRMLWYQFGPFPAYYQTGRFEEVVALADATLALTTQIEELHYWRGMGLAALGDAEEAATEFRSALEQRPGYPEATEALEALGG